MIRTWKDNPFWDNEEKTRVKAILEIEMEDGVTTSQVMTINQFDAETGDLNPDWIELMDVYGEEYITSQTEQRNNDKAFKARLKKIQEEENRQAKKLEKLFNFKLEAFEIEEIKNSNNRQLKAKLRRASSITEVNVYAMMIIMEQLNNESGTE